MKSQSENLFDLANMAWDANDLAQAYKLFVQAAHKGNHYALNTIGYFFDNGICVPKDQNTALFWYRRAARFKDSCAYSNIASIYRDRGNFQRARFWFLKAVGEGDDDAAFELAKLILAKKGKRLTTQAKHLLHIAAQSEQLDPADRQDALRLLAAIGKNQNQQA
jgi:TPR repeat protein